MTDSLPDSLPDSLLAALLAALASAAFTYWLIPFAPRVGLVDHPGGRKHHAVPTPLIGGLAVFLTIMLSSILFGHAPGNSWSLFAALMVTLLVGLADDAHEIGHRSKFFAQLIAALIVVSGTAVHVTHLGDLLGFGDISLGKWSYMVTAIAIIGLMNALNMIDGLDGLSGTQTLIPLLALSVFALGSDRTALALEMLVLIGAISGFLYFNLRTPWRVKAAAFMGDTGGMLLGLLLAWYSVELAGANDAPLRPITAVWILAVPLLDMGSVMLLRILQHESPFHADRQHLHHVLVDGGYTVSQTVAIMVGVSIFCALLALQAQQADVAEAAMFGGFLAFWATYLAALAKPERTRKLMHLMIAPGNVAST